MDGQAVREWLRDERHAALIDELAALHERLGTPEELARPVRHARRGAWRWRGVAAAVVVGIAAFLLYTGRDREASPGATPGETIRPGTVKARLLLPGDEEVELDATTRTIASARVEGIENDSSRGLDYTRAVTLESPEGEGSFNTLKIPTGGFYRLTLSDGTRVWLNSESELHFPVCFATGERVVSLRGEGYFDVARDERRAFRVQVGEMTVTVLGTSININAYRDDGHVYTTLLEGALSVRSTRRGEETLLRPGTQCVFNAADGTVALREVEAGRYRSWIEGRFVFDSMNLQQIMRQLQRWYDFSFYFRDQQVREYAFRGVIPRDMPFDTVLAMIAKTTNVKFEINGKQVTISRR
jgi:ferric-dicitrate binding protein FerR (iron transport regulator)